EPGNISYYFQDSGGDADRLPNGNTIGIFANKALTNGVPDPVIVTEVSDAGEIVWELQVPGENNTYYWTHRLERFYEAPLIDVDNDTLDLDLTVGTLSFDLTTWNSYKVDGTTNGTLKVFANGNELHSESFEFLTHWQPNNFEIALSNLPTNVNYIQVTVTNDDGLEGSLVIFGDLPSSPPQFGLAFPLAISLCVAIPAVLVILIKTGKLNLKRAGAE
ncbi:MAG: hypothetical protein ACXAEF_16400, partial [Candidatus Thorarchaeota archaeon]